MTDAKEMNPANRPKTVFIMGDGLYQFKVMPTGLKKVTKNISETYGTCFERSPLDVSFEWGRTLTIILKIRHFLDKYV